MVSEYDFHAEFTSTDEFARLNLFMRAERIVTSQNPSVGNAVAFMATRPRGSTPLHTLLTPHARRSLREVAFVHATALPAPPLGLAPDTRTPPRSRSRRRHRRSQQLGRRRAALAWRCRGWHARHRPPPPCVAARYRTPAHTRGTKQRRSVAP